MCHMRNEYTMWDLIDDISVALPFALSMMMNPIFEHELHHF